MYIPEQIQMFRESTIADDIDDKQFALTAIMTHVFLILHAPIEDIVAKFGQS